jgi:predicted membrane protein
MRRVEQTASCPDWAADCYLVYLVYCVRREKKMPLINIVIALIVVGVALWLINNFIPMAGSIKTILNIVVVISVAIWVLQAVGLWGRVTSYKFVN